MNLPKDNMIIKQKQEQHIEDEDCPWILGNPKIISKMGKYSLKDVQNHTR